MGGFLKTFGKGILYFLASPFAIVFLVVYGVFLLFVNIGTFFRIVKEKCSKKKTKIQELDEKALIIMQANKYSSDTNNISESHVTNNNIVIANKEDLVNLINSINSQNQLEEPKKMIEDSTIDENDYKLVEDSQEIHGENIKRIK